MRFFICSDRNYFSANSISIFLEDKESVILFTVSSSSEPPDFINFIIVF
jgi:hypothetical protein